ncbi:hypothetical protein M569_15328, partial [Genlisea aurea]
NSGRKLWGFPRFAGGCANGHRKPHSVTSTEQKIDLTNSCSQMILQLHNVYDPNKINVRIKIVSGTPSGIVAAEAGKIHANWVVFDKQLKHEEKRCMEELQCNIVVMKRSQAKVLRLHLVGSPETEPEVLVAEKNKGLSRKNDSRKECLNSTRAPVVTPSSSPEAFTATEAGTGTGTGTSSVSSSDLGTSPFFTNAVINSQKKGKLLSVKQEDIRECSSDTDDERLSMSSSSNLRFKPWMAEMVASSCCQSLDHHGESSAGLAAMSSSTRALLEKLSTHDDGECCAQSPSRPSSVDFCSSWRDSISVSRAAPLGPPPLCSICQHKAPEFGKPPKWFTYAELELATEGFSQANFLAEGGFGSVHRGVLPDGQTIAVKQHKLASCQGDQEFCSEVEVLSCAQHRNVVMLIGFCIEDGRRLLVYEYICNGSLDSHLYGRNQSTLSWSGRQKIAVGAARGLRYLHEECRVGCIVHRDMRPNNILITHDFDSMVGDFGLARWQPDGEIGVETRVIGTFGYLAPEYAQSGQITEKADVYSFGVVLVELVTGLKAVDLNRPKGQQCLTEWAKPLLETEAIDELIDPRLGNDYCDREILSMLHAASLCLSRDPQARPRMSQVVRMLEGDLCGSDGGSRSGR